MLQLKAVPEASKPEYKQSYAEDYFSDDGQTENNGVFIYAPTLDPWPGPSPGKANVHTKRSNPELVGTEETPTGRAPTFDIKSICSSSLERSPPVVPVVTCALPPTPLKEVPDLLINHKKAQRAHRMGHDNGSRVGTRRPHDGLLLKDLL